MYVCALRVIRSESHMSSVEMYTKVEERNLQDKKDKRDRKTEVLKHLTK